VGVSAAQLLLTLDRGNTTLDAMLHGSGPAGRRRARLDPDDPAALREFLAGSRPTACTGVTVVPGGLAAAERVLAECGVRLQLVGREIHCPLQLDYQTPETLGADRWLAALAAHRRQAGPAVVIDCGSATTVDLIDRDGVFRGGTIAPGLPALAAGMRAVTPQLPAVDAAGPVAVPPRNTGAAVGMGLALAFCGAVERLVAETLAASRGLAVILITGGHAEQYLRHGRLAAEHVPDLVHQGLRLLWPGAAENSCDC